METVLAGLHFKICLVYIDDIFVFGKTLEENLQNLQQVFKILQQAGLKLKPSKCTLFKKEVLFLCYRVSGLAVQTDPHKIVMIKNWPLAIDPIEERSFLDLCSYYRRFIAGLSSIAKQLFRLAEKGRVFKWTTECNGAFEKLKCHLVSIPILDHPDFSLPFVLDTVASHVGIGAVLSQEIVGHMRVISYASRTLSKSERKYCVTSKKLLAVVYACQQFHHYLCGHKAIVRTDHSALKWLMSFNHQQGQVAIWVEFIGTYDLDIRHRLGAKHSNANNLRRYPCLQCGITKESEINKENPEVNIIHAEETVKNKHDLSIKEL